MDEDYSKNQPEQKHVSDPEETAEKLAPLLDMKEKEVKEMLETGMEKNRFQVEFGENGKNLPKETMNEIKELNLPGIYFLEDALRYYPNGMFASHIIGFAKMMKMTGKSQV